MLIGEYDRVRKGKDEVNRPKASFATVLRLYWIIIVELCSAVQHTLCSSGLYALSLKSTDRTSS